MSYGVMYDETKDPGERLAPEVRAEIALIAPSVLQTGAVKTHHLEDDAITAAKIAPGAVGTVQIATSGVATVNIAPEAVTESKIADDAVTPDKTATGILTIVDSAGNYVEQQVRLVTAAELAAIGIPDPNTTYWASA